MTIKPFVKFPTGKVWRQTEDCWITGVVIAPNFGDYEDLESKLDSLSEAVTGSIAGLTDFSYAQINGDLVEFSGSYDTMLEDEDEEDCPMGLTISQAREGLMATYGLADFEVDHALAVLADETVYENECKVQTTNGREIAFPAYPAECDYVRVVLAGLELSYWSQDEWREAPAEVMGALLGAVRKPVG